MEGKAITARQREILALVADGMHNREIGVRLSISEGTVNEHVKRILARLGVPNRAAAAVTLYRVPAPAPPPVPSVDMESLTEAVRHMDAACAALRRALAPANEQEA